MSRWLGWPTRPDIITLCVRLSSGGKIYTILDCERCFRLFIAIKTPECKQLGVRIARGGRYFVERINHSLELKTFYEKKRWSRITNHSLKQLNIPFVKIESFAL